MRYIVVKKSINLMFFFLTPVTLFQSNDEPNDQGMLRSKGG